MVSCNVFRYFFRSIFLLLELFFQVSEANVEKMINMASSIATFFLFYFFCPIEYSLATSLDLNPARDNSPDCDCYVVSGPSPGYFQYHRFFDFRNMPNEGDNDFTNAPPLITEAEDQGLEPITSAYFNSSAFTDDWTIQTWVANTSADAPVQRINSAQNVYFARNTTAGAENSTYLNLRASRARTFISTAELDN